MKKSLGALTLAFPTPVFVVGTYDAAGTPNIMTAAWGGICCSKPPCLGVALRKATYTYGSLMERRAFTVSIPSAAFAAQADGAGMLSGRDGDKFRRLGLTPARAGTVDAPYVAEFPMHVECAVLHALEIGLHTWFVGEIKDVCMDAACLDAEGLPDLGRLDPLAFAPELRAYFTLGRRAGEAFSLGKEYLGPK